MKQLWSAHPTNLSTNEVMEELQDTQRFQQFIKMMALQRLKQQLSYEIIKLTNTYNIMKWDSHQGPHKTHPLNYSVLCQVLYSTKTNLLSRRYTFNIPYLHN